MGADSVVGSAAEATIAEASRKAREASFISEEVVTEEEWGGRGGGKWKRPRGKGAYCNDKSRFGQTAIAKRIDELKMLRISRQLIH